MWISSDYEYIDQNLLGSFDKPVEDLPTEYSVLHRDLSSVQPTGSLSPFRENIILENNEDEITVELFGTDEQELKRNNMPSNRTSSITARHNKKKGFSVVSTKDDQEYFSDDDEKL